MSSSTDSAILQSPLFNTFTLFPKLSLELRLQIWTEAAPAPRVVTQTRSAKPSRACRRVPTILHVCQESRHEFLADGKRKRSHPTYTLVNVLYPMYFSFEYDTLYLLSDDILDPTMGPKVQNLAIDLADLETLTARWDLSSLPTSLTKLPSYTDLKNLTLLFHTKADNHLIPTHPNGQIHFGILVSDYLPLLILGRLMVEQLLENMQEKNKAWKFPCCEYRPMLKFRADRDMYVNGGRGKKVVMKYESPKDGTIYDEWGSILTKGTICFKAYQTMIESARKK